MSRAGANRPKALAPDGTEVKPGDIRLLGPPPSDEIVLPPTAERAFKANRVYLQTKARIFGADACLYPAYAQGSLIAEHLLRRMVRR